MRQNVMMNRSIDEEEKITSSEKLTSSYDFDDEDENEDHFILKQKAKDMPFLKSI